VVFERSADGAGTGEDFGAIGVIAPIVAIEMSTSFVPKIPKGILVFAVMGKNAKGRGTLSAVVDEKIIDLIDERRERLTMSRSTYLTLIIQQWIRSGCPPVSHAEKAIEALEGAPLRQLKKAR